MNRSPIIVIEQHGNAACHVATSTPGTFKILLQVTKASLHISLVLEYAVALEKTEGKEKTKGIVLVMSAVKISALRPFIHVSDNGRDLREHHISASWLRKLCCFFFFGFF